VTGTPPRAAATEATGAAHPPVRPGPAPAGADPDIAKRAVAIVFGVNGLLFATWVSRLPAVRDLLHLTPGGLGLLLLCISAGAVSSLLASGFIVHRLGPARAVLIPAAVMTVSLAVAGTTPAIPVLAVLLVLMGAGTSVWDVAMNVEGAQVEQLVGRAIMPRFHAGFSLGTVGGAGLGAAAAALGVPVAVHLPVVAAVGLVVVAWAVRRFVVMPAPTRTVSGGRRSSGVLRAWKEPRTLVIGLLVLGMAFSEGTANDWLAVGLVDGYHADHAVAALGFGVFVTAMTAARMAGPSILERFGRVLAVRSGALLVGLGVIAVVVGSQVIEAAGRAAGFAVAAVGALAWGVGAALGFPVGMSAAADDPERAAARVSVVSAIGYVAFLAGPPILGLLGDRVGIVRALLAVGGAVVVSLLAAGSLRPLSEASGGSTAPVDTK
jgi:hypothetical protein